MTSDPTPSSLEYGDAVRRQIEHEDVLIVNRLSWLMASQSFLFTAYAIVLGGPLQTRVPRFTDQQELLTHLIPILAITACVLIYLGVIGAVRVMASLRRELARHHAELGNLRPPIQGSNLTIALGHAAPVLLPLAFGTAWMVLLWSH